MQLMVLEVGLGRLKKSTQSYTDILCRGGGGEACVHLQGFTSWEEMLWTRRVLYINLNLSKYMEGGKDWDGGRRKAELACLSQQGLLTG